MKAKTERMEANSDSPFFALSIKCSGVNKVEAFFWGEFIFFFTNNFPVLVETIGGGLSDDFNEFFEVIFKFKS
jgi:hypothetical protein